VLCARQEIHWEDCVCVESDVNPSGVKSSMTKWPWSLNFGLASISLSYYVIGIFGQKLCNSGILLIFPPIILNRMLLIIIWYFFIIFGLSLGLNLQKLASVS